MSISTPQTGGERRPTARKATATGNPPAKKAAAKSGTSSTPAKSGSPAKSTSGAKVDSASAKSASTKTSSAKASAAKASAAKASAKLGAARGSGGSKAAAGSRLAKGGRSIGAPVKVRQGANWFSIGLITVVALVAVGIIGFMSYQVYLHGEGWQKKADRISGVVDYRKSDPSMLTRNHQGGVIKYKVSPPVGGNHNPNWQRCQGDVYDQQIPSENAVHSLEHGAVWITYRPGLPQAQVDALKAKVTGNDFMLMSPYPGLDKPISLQAWGFQLKVDNASDSRIDEFIKDLRQNAAMEPNTPCSTGSYVTGTGSQPYDPSAPTPGASGSAAPAATASAPAPKPSS
jgi:hypothetical protein